MAAGSSVTPTLPNPGTRSLAPNGGMSNCIKPSLGNYPAAKLMRIAPPGAHRGFTLIELLIVISMMAIATAGISFAIRDSGDQQLQRDAERLATLLESARAQARTNGSMVVWQPMPQGFRFEGLPTGVTMPAQWLQAGIEVMPRTPVVLGPEPLIPPQSITLTLAQSKAAPVRVATDGLRPFQVLSP